MIYYTAKKGKEVMMRLPNKNITYCLLLVIVIATSCVREPELHLHHNNQFHIHIPAVRLDLNVIWNYSDETDWNNQWLYGWDVVDEEIFGNFGYEEPSAFEIRRYFNNDNPLASHSNIYSSYITGNTFIAEYKTGYYDILAWNEIKTTENTQSIIIDETTSLDSVTARTNMSLNKIKSPKMKLNNQDYSYYQPENLFTTYIKGLLITNNPEDYDYFDEATHTYVKKINGDLNPLVYIYLVQVILHNNNGKIIGTDGNANLNGMADGTCLNTGITSNNNIVVYFNTRFKTGLRTNSGELVDICGGRTTTFGICDTNPYKITEDELNDTHEHLLDVNLQFANGKDSTFIFNVTDQVRKHFRGGVLTIELNMDTIPMPSTNSGSGFDPIVDEYEDGGTHEIEM